MWIAETVIITVAASRYDYGSLMPHVGSSSTDPLDGTWRLWRVRFSNVQSADVADDQYLSFEIVNMTNGNVDGTWTDTDFANVYAYIDQFVGTLAPHCANFLAADMAQVYVRGFNPYSNSKPFASTGAPEREFVMNHPGGMTLLGAPQGCTTVTEMTGDRRHWGRFYTPSLGNNSYASSGRIDTAFVNSLATATHDLYNNLMANQYIPVVATTTSGGSKGVPGQPARILQTVSAVRVDDVPDVQRKRRPKNALLRVTQPIEAQQQPSGSTSS